MGYKERVYHHLPNKIKPLAKRIYKRSRNNHEEKSNQYVGEVFERSYELMDMISISDPVIVDAGANIGEVTEVFLEQYPSSTIHAIEPVPKHVQKLEQKFGEEPNVDIHDVAVSNERGTVEFNVARKSDTSSIYDSSDTLFSLREEQNRAEVYETEEILEVSQVRIGDIVKDIDLIKLDIQGKELDALKGIKNIESIEVIISETMFLPHYENQPLFCDINKYLNDKRFQLYGLYSLFDGSTGQLEFANALFLNERHFDEDLVLKDDLRRQESN